MRSGETYPLPLRFSLAINHFLLTPYMQRIYRNPVFADSDIRDHRLLEHIDIDIYGAYIYIYLHILWLLK